MPKPKINESKNDYVVRCMSDEEMNKKYPEASQRFVVCNAIYKNEKLEAEKISFDFDGTLNTSKGKELAKQLIDKGAQLYIISARDNKQGMQEVADTLNIPSYRIYAMGSNELKIFKIKDLGINTHYDNNIEVINKLNGIGKLI